MIDTTTLPAGTREGHAILRAHAARIAGAPGDIAQRVMAHHQIYRDSNANHTFPLVALHGALWAAGFFETTGRLGDALRARYFYDARERAFRMQLLGGFAEGFKSVNRQVFIDTFTNYFFTRHYGTRPDASGYMHPDLFAALNTMHAATREGRTMDAAQKRHLFLQALQFEQEVTVAPGVRAEVSKFDCPILTFLCLRPIVRFAYFPRRTYFWFRNFADTSERIARALASYDIAARAGWTVVEDAMRSSPVLPGAYWSDPAGFIQRVAA